VTTPEPARFHPNEVLRRFKALVPHLRIDTLNRLVDVVQAMITGQTVNLSAAPTFQGRVRTTPKSAVLNGLYGIIS
jgi:hypothetical protein